MNVFTIISSVSQADHPPLTADRFEPYPALLQPSPESLSLRPDSVFRLLYLPVPSPCDRPGVVGPSPFKDGIAYSSSRGAHLFLCLDPDRSPIHNSYSFSYPFPCLPHHRKYSSG